MLRESDSGVQTMQSPKSKEIEELAKEYCYYLGEVKDCCGNCDICEGNKKWKQYKVPVKRLIIKWEKIKEVKE